MFSKQMKTVLNYITILALKRMSYEIQKKKILTKNISLQRVINKNKNRILVFIYYYYHFFFDGYFYVLSFA